MAGIVVLGTQWGDEGKGRFVDYFSQKADLVVRFSGGNNAGHTVVYQGKQFLFTILPSGALAGKKLAIAAGACFNPKVLVEEIENIEKLGLKVNLLIDPRVHLVMPYHCQRDVANEARRGKEGVGSVGFGIGFCFMDRAGRANLRFEDLIEPKRAKTSLAKFYPQNKEILEKIYKVKIEPEEKILKDLLIFGRKLKKYLADVSLVIRQMLKEGKTVLFEGSQGVLLDVNFGTYPYTTGSHIIAGYVFPSVGLPPQKLKVIGIVKSFCSRAGGGPFPTEIKTVNGPGKHILEVGHEYEEFPGIPTRARRVGWLDLVLLRYAQSLNNFSSFALTHLDTLAGLRVVKVCRYYLYKGKKFFLPPFPGMTDKIKPVYQELKGWPKIEKEKIKSFFDLPQEARNFILMIEKETGVPVKYISLASERKAVLVR